MVRRQRDDAGLNFLDSRPFTTAFVSGNHENYDALAAYPQAEWHGGRVRTIRPSVLMLERGQVFDLGGRMFFAMGGASSTISRTASWSRTRRTSCGGSSSSTPTGAAFRVNHRSWWREELPNEAEYAEPGPISTGPGGRWTTSSPTAVPPASRTICWDHCPNQMPSLTSGGDRPTVPVQVSLLWPLSWK